MTFEFGIPTFSTKEQWPLLSPLIMLPMLIYSSSPGGWQQEHLKAWEWGDNSFCTNIIIENCPQKIPAKGNLA